METYATRHGLAFAPHGKTSMAPQLFARQLEHGAWGITAAVPTQARVYRTYGIQRIFLANELVDAAALRWLAGELDADPDFRFICYVDSLRGIELMDTALREAGATRPVDVVVELGAGEGARTGVRTEAECLELADAIAGVDTLRLVGVAGYEGEVPDATPERVTAWLRRLVALAVEFDKAGRFADLDQIVVSAGGSAWFDAVAEVFAEIPELSAPGPQAAALGRVRLARRRPLPQAHPLQPRPGGGRPPARLPPVGAGRLPPHPRAGVPQRGQARRRLRPRTCPRPRSYGPAGTARCGRRTGSPSPACPTSTPGSPPSAPATWRSVTGSASACRTPARPSTSGS